MLTEVSIGDEESVVALDRVQQRKVHSRQSLCQPSVILTESPSFWHC